MGTERQELTAGHRASGLLARAGRALSPLAVSALLLAAVPAFAQSDGSYSQETARKVFATGLDNLSSVYIRKVNLGTFATEALKGLATVDPSFSVEQRNGRVHLTVASAGVADFTAPGDDNAGGWADLMARAVGAARTHSYPLNAEAPEKLYQAVFDAGMTSLDKYSRYAGADTARENRASREGFGGIGIRLDNDNGTVIVQSVLPNTPAEKAGLKANDKILRVASRPTNGMELKDVVSLMRGKVGSPLALEVEREGNGQPLRFDIKRALIVPPTVTLTKADDIAEIKITSFNHDTGISLSNILDGLRNGKNGKTSGIVLDLRNNPGGLLDQAVVVSDLFLTSGQIVSTRGRHPDSTQLFNATGRDAAKGLPVVALINGSSASAAEIVAGALQDRGRAVLVGTGSFGKGSVQTVIRMPNDGELTLTWAHFHAPSGYSINRLGVFPVICTSPAVPASQGLAEAISQGNLRSMVDLTQRRAADAFAETGKDELHKVCPYQSGSTSSASVNGVPPADSEMQVAKALLRQPELYQRALKQSVPSLAARQ
ncbi:MAG: S41 family peptidase [Hyphomicrobiaceae bacterium]|nr:S41 family peptidase [Hyphomicrobiaceae bacterium]